MLLNLANSEESEIKFSTSKFPGGEIHFRIESYPEWRFCNNVRITCRINGSDDLIRLCLAIDALRREGYDWFVITIPYIPYARQDRKCNKGEAHSLKVFSNILNSLKLNEITCYDPHSDVCEALIENLVIRDNQELVDWTIRDINKEAKLNCINVLSPDAGQSKKIYKLFKGYDEGKIHIYECSKIRDLKTTEIKEVRVPIIPGPEPILIIDDICDGGRTFIEIAKKLRETSQNDLYLCVSHGIFSHGETELSKYFKHIYTTNSIRDEDTVISVGIRPVPSKLISRMKVI